MSDDLCGGPSLTPPGYYDLPEAEQEMCQRCSKWFEVDTLKAGLCKDCQDGEEKPLLRWNHPVGKERCSCDFSRIWNQYPLECGLCMKILPD